MYVNTSIKSNVPGIHVRYCPNSDIIAMMTALYSNTVVVPIHRCISSIDMSQAPSG